MRNYNETNEIREIVRSLNSLPTYRDYQYDHELGFYKGPQSIDSIPISIKIMSNEAIIGLKQPIPKMAQHHLLLVEKDKDNWKIKKVLEISER